MPEKAANDQVLEMLESIGQRGFAYAWQILRDRDDALDAVQAALTSVWQSRRKLQLGRDPRGWFFRILRNKCVDTLRSRKAHATTSLAADPPAANPRDPARDADRDEASQQLRRALDDLSDDMREIILLRDYHDLSYAEIADVLHIPPGTVMSRIHRARTTLRDRLTQGVLP